MSYICIYRVPKKGDFQDLSLSAFPNVKIRSCSYVDAKIGAMLLCEICHFGISDFIPLNYWAWMSITCPLMVGSPVLSTEGLEADTGIAG